MRQKSTPSTGPGKNYVRFAGITLAAALLVAMAVDSGPRAQPAAATPVAPATAQGARPAVKKPAPSFAAEGAAPQAALAFGESPEAADPAASRPDPTRPPPGDPAEQIGQQHFQAPGDGGFRPSQDQAGNLIAQSRARSGGVDQGDEALAPS